NESRVDVYEPHIRPCLDKLHILYREVLLSEVDDFLTIENTIKNEIQIDKDRLEAESDEWNWSADYTSGTKSMSAALVIAALYFEFDSLSYIAGERRQGRVLPGAERIQNLRLHRHYWRAIESRLGLLADSGQFRAALDLLDSCERQEEIATDYERWQLLLDLLYAWDVFDYKNAHKYMLALKKLKLPDYINSWIKKKELVLDDLTRNNTIPSLERIVDLYHNARRRLYEGKADDALSRLYRMMEMMAQHRIRKHFNLTDPKLPAKMLTPDLEKKFSECIKDGIFKGGIAKSLELLADVGDEFGRSLYTEYASQKSRVRRLLDKRNFSCLAHGFLPITPEDAKALAAELEILLNAHFEGWKRYEDILTLVPLKGDIRS
ncbi:MAG TPA: TIGR02710 family CRISPR-associated CARF protein, partial [bacterium]|nr:TIGR02710 family CRISPR-associated CARF protein [bacterium]